MSATALYAAGYTDLVRVARGEKRPVQIGWQNIDVTADMAAAWDDAGANIGLRGDRFPGIDIDCGQNARLAEEVVRHAGAFLGGAPKRFSPKAGSRLLVYRTSEPFLKMTLTFPDDAGAVEILPTGRQYLVKGVHPAGGPYTWNVKDLWDVPSGLLTEIDAAKAHGFLLLLQEEYGGRIHIAREHKEVALPPEKLAAPSLKAVEMFLDVCPNSDAFLAEAFPSAGDSRDTWVAFGHAVKGAGGDPALPAFLKWTSRYTDGPVDLGLAEKAFAGFVPERYGWPTLQRIYRTQIQTPDAVFEDDLTDEPEPRPDVPDESVPLSDEEMVDFLLPILRRRIAYVAGAWRIWSGAKWELDEGLAAEMIVRRFLRPQAVEMYARGKEMVARGTEDEVKELVSKGRAFCTAAKRYQSQSGIDSIVKLCRGPLSRNVRDFDNDLMALNTPAGMVDLRSGTVRPTEPEDLVSRTTSVSVPGGGYNPAKAPNWESFLEYLTKGSADYRAFLQRYMGYCLTGHMGEKKLTFIWGSNSNTGKSTFVNAIMYALGDYAAVVDVDTFMSTRRSNTDDLAQLPGVRLVTATEPSAGQKWDDKLVKAITGGDPITARRLYESHFTFQPQFKILIAGNHQPEMKNVDTALLKRVLIAPMNRTVSEPDRELGRKLQDEASHILQWMLDGCLGWQTDGLAPPAMVTDVTDEYSRDEDTLAAWLDSECVLEEDGWTVTEDLWHSYAQYQNRQGVRYTGNSRLFNRELSARTEALTEQEGFEIGRHKRKRWGYKGITLKTLEDF